MHPHKENPLEELIKSEIQSAAERPVRPKNSKRKEKHVTTNQRSEGLRKKLN